MLFDEKSFRIYFPLSSIRDHGRRRHLSQTSWNGRWEGMADKERVA